MDRSSSSKASIEKCERKEVKIDIDLSNKGIEEYKRQQLKIGSEEKLKPASDCCIFRVPANLRKLKEDAYTPQFMSIGPFHYGNTELAAMEKQKLRYKEDFGKRFTITTEEGWGVLVNYIEKNEQRIHDCYAEPSDLPKSEFIVMILYDAIFIIELLLKSYNSEDDFLIDNSRIQSGIELDLQVIENQLPYFALKELYKLAIQSYTEETPSFLTLSCDFFLGIDREDDIKYLFGDAKEEAEEEIKHFLDLRRTSLVKNLPGPKDEEINDDPPSAVKLHEAGKEIDGDLPSAVKLHESHEENDGDLPSAVKLHESGVKFKRIESKCLLDIKFEKAFVWVTCFKVDELRIPHITIEDNTEYLFRNMMALEQCHYSYDTHICNYVDLIDSLINTEKDVDLLVDARIMSNFVGDHAAIAKMFNNLCLQITLSEPSCYKDIIRALIQHHGKWWNRTKAILMRVYFSNLWRGTGTTAAFILLVLTLLQTIYTMGA